MSIEEIDSFVENVPEQCVQGTAIMTETSCLNCIHAIWDPTETEHPHPAQYEGCSEYGLCDMSDYTSGGVISRVMPRFKCPYWDPKIKENVSDQL
jgi:hypothetical protein